MCRGDCYLVGKPPSLVPQMHFWVWVFPWLFSLARHPQWKLWISSALLGDWEIYFWEWVLVSFPSSGSTSQATWARIKLSSYLILLLGPLSPACGTWLEEHSPTKRITKSHNAWNPNNHHEIGTSPPLCQPST